LKSGRAWGVLIIEVPLPYRVEGRAGAIGKNEEPIILVSLRDDTILGESARHNCYISGISYV